ncbi:hypothetical protein RBB50_011555 [Rhinocladiella similis]
MANQGSAANWNQRRINTAAPPGQRQGRGHLQERQQEIGSSLQQQQQALGRAQPTRLPTRPAPVQHPLGGTFAGPAGQWRQYTPREVDAYHGLLALRYGPIVEFPRTENSQLTMSSLARPLVGSGNASQNQSASRNDNRTVVVAAAAAATAMGPPALPGSHRPQGGSPEGTQPYSQTQTNDRAKDKGKGKPKQPAKRYSCYLCEYTALGVAYVGRHLQNKHGVPADQVDRGRIEASEVQCLW